MYVVAIPVLVAALQLSGCGREATVPPPPPGGVYRSDSAGASFEQAVAIKGKPGEYIADFALNEVFRLPERPTDIYIAAGPNGVVRSVDDGYTWEVLATPLTQTLDVVMLDNGVLVASGTDGSGQGFVIRSLDVGKSWQSVLTVPVPTTGKQFEIIQSQPQSVSVVISIERDPFQPNRVYAASSLGTLFSGEQSAKVWRTYATLTVEGFDAITGQQTVPIQKLVASPHRPGELLIISNNQELIRVRGTEQEKITVPQYIDTPPPFGATTGSKKVVDVSFVPEYPDAILVGVEDGAVVTRDGGVTWLQMPLPLESSQRFNSVVVTVSPTNTNRYIVAVNDVIYRSEDGGQTWNTFAFGLAGRVIRDLSINPANAARVLAVTQLLQI